VTRNATLVAEAREHIDHLCEGLPEPLASSVRAGVTEDRRLSLLVRLTDALEATIPRAGVKYATVRSADDNPQVGELVQSKFSSSGVVWRIESVQPIPAGRRRTFELDVVSLSSGRSAVRYASNLLIVEATE